MDIKNFSLFRFANFINGEWVAAHNKATFAVTNPATGEVIGEVPLSGLQETNEAIDAAYAAFKPWSTMPAKSRGVILRKWHDLIVTHADELALILSLEQGKPVAEAKGEVLNGCSFVDWFAEEGRRSYGEIIPSPWPNKQPITVRQAVGVAAAITPWNFPSSMITRKAAPALAAGCTVVLKPASATPFSALALAALAHEAGFPAGVFNVVTGSASAIGAALCNSPRVRALSFTGSTSVGKALMRDCSNTLKKVSLELGGNAPFIVFADADLDIAVPAALGCKFRNAGQTCICANRIYVEHSILPAFLERFVAAAQALTLGIGTDPATTMGPLIDAAAITHMQELISDAQTKGATIHCGGKAPNRAGTFFEPTIISNVTPEMRVLNEEIFGPIAPVVSFTTEEEVIGHANNTPYGLASYVYTKDIGRVWRVTNALEYGLVGANEIALATGEAPFGGIKESGLGKEGGKQGLDEFMETKYILLGNLDK